VIEATIGGTRKHVVDAARGQRRRGLDVWLAASAEREPAFRADLGALASEGVEVREIPMARQIRPGRDLAHLRALSELVREARPDVVHTHSSKAGVLGRLASLDAGCGARVHTPHTFAFLFGAMFGPLTRRLYREIESALAGATERMVAVSPGEAESFRASGIVAGEKIRVVPNGIDPAPWLAARPAELASLGVPEGAPVAAVIGLLNVAKGQDLALRALARAGLERVHLLVAGHGAQRAELERLASELGLAPRVHMLGWRDDVPALVAASDVVLVPSRWEGLPYAALEAMAAAKPVVATRVDGARDVVLDGQSGRLVAPESPEELGDALAEVLALSPAERERWGLAGRERVLARFTLERMLDLLLGVYAEVA